jgi:hypothetical protein
MNNVLRTALVFLLMIGTPNSYGWGFFKNVWGSNESVNGAATYINKTLETLKSVHGALTANTTLFKQNLEVAGHTQLGNSHLYGTFKGAGALNATDTIFDKKVTISGAVELENSIFKGPLTVKGSLEAQHSTFETTVEVKGGVAFSNNTRAADIIVAGGIILENSQVNNITVQSLRKGKVVIRGKNATVTGTITFNSGKGIVYLQDHASLDKNQVEGGIIKTTKSK